MAEILSVPDSGNQGIPFSIPIGGNGNGLFGGGNTNLIDILGFAIIASMFGWNNGGFGGFGGNGANGAGFISNQLNNENGRQLIMQAVTANGEAQRTAIQSLATTIGTSKSKIASMIFSSGPSEMLRMLCLIESLTFLIIANL